MKENKIPVNFHNIRTIYRKGFNVTDVLFKEMSPYLEKLWIEYKKSEWGYEIPEELKNLENFKEIKRMLDEDSLRTIFKMRETTQLLFDRFLSQIEGEHLKKINKIIKDISNNGTLLREIHEKYIVDLYNNISNDSLKLLHDEIKTKDKFVSKLKESRDIINSYFETIFKETDPLKLEKLIEKKLDYLLEKKTPLNIENASTYLYYKNIQTILKTIKEQQLRGLPELNKYILQHLVDLNVLNEFKLHFLDDYLNRFNSLYNDLYMKEIFKKGGKEAKLISKVPGRKQFAIALIKDIAFKRLKGQFIALKTKLKVYDIN
ncbi:MAG: hypothetical protein FJZ11_07395, partial [Candidatus Omnitrophica bacterium]|nr:hypothetical protein [Candidatus Omnitrophota bacterium]